MTRILLLYKQVCNGVIMILYNYTTVTSYKTSLVGCCLANNVCIGKLPATRGVWVIIGYSSIMKGSWANKIVCCKTVGGVHSTMHAPQLRSYNYYNIIDASMS